jgi:hypothetical protein
MAAPMLKVFSVGLNAVRYYALTATGYPAATNATVYAGVSIGGPTSLSLETTAPEVVTHPGNNAIQQYDVLPSNGIAGGSLTVSREDAAAIAAFTNTKVHVISTSFNAIGWNTSQQGSEPVFGLLAYDQAKDTSGNRIWRTHMIPRCIITPQIKGMARERADLTYNLQPLVSSSYLTGLAFGSTNNGFSTAQVVTFTSYHRLTVASWVTTSTEAEYVFDTDFPKYITGSPGIAVYKNGVEMTYGATADITHYTATTTKITFGAALTNTDVVTAIYEIDDTAIDIDT